MTMQAQPVAPGSHHHRTWAWALVGLTPVGVLLAVVALVAMLGVTGAVSFPRDQFGASFEPVGLVVSLFVAGVIALAAPSFAVIQATYAVRSADPRAQRALTASWIAFAIALVLDGGIGVVLWAPVLFVVLRRQRLPMPG